MKQPMKGFSLFLSALGILCLILDSKCASESAVKSLDLCIRTVIPSLFPMFVLSGMVVSGLSGSTGGLMRRLERLLRLPERSGGIFLVGAIGGFPVGAQCIGQAISQGCFGKDDGERMLGFCNNCSPAFLFGIAGSLFGSPLIPLLIWTVQLESAMLIAVCWPGKRGIGKTFTPRNVTMPEAVNRAIRSMVSVCAWIILAGVLSGFLERWLFPILAFPFPEILRGMLELTGGILGLSGMENTALQMLFCSFFTCFGGICVLLQIQSIASDAGLSMRTYFQQKVVQGLIGTALSAGAISVGPAFLLAVPFFLVTRKIMVEKTTKTMYNSIRKGGF